MGRSDPRAMPLDQYIAEVMEILKTQPDAQRDLRGASEAAALRGRERQVQQVFQTAQPGMDKRVAIAPV